MFNIPFEELEALKTNAALSRSLVEQNKQTAYRILDHKPDKLAKLVLLSKRPDTDRRLEAEMMLCDDLHQLVQFMILYFLHDYTDRTIAIAEERRSRESDPEGEP